MDLAGALLETAARVGADAAESPGRMIADLSEGPGADVVIEASGDPDGFVLCTRVVRAGGPIANIGTHGKPATLHLESLWRMNVTISTGQVDTSSRAAPSQEPSKSSCTASGPPDAVCPAGFRHTMRTALSPSCDAGRGHDRTVVLSTRNRAASDSVVSSG